MFDSKFPLRSALGRALRNPYGLARNCNGATAVVFAISLVPIMGAVGAAIDFGRAYSAQAQLQTAADAAALAGAATPSNATPDPEAIAEAVFNSQTQGLSFASNVNVSASAVDDTTTVTVDAQVSSPFLHILGSPTIDVSVVAAARSPGFEAEVVLVLDYSSSMDGTKYQNMRDGAVELVNIITNQQTNTNVSIALVPFADEVYTSLPGDYVLGGTPGTTWTNCTGDRKWPYNTDDSTPTGDDATKWGRVNDNDTIEVTEYDTCANYPTHNLIVRPLTNDHAGTVAQLQAMTPHAGTNIALGLQHGWQTISPEAPYTEGTAYGSEKKKVIILLTDGRQHTEGFGTGGDRTTDNAIANIDTLCTGVKNKNIILVTVAYEVDDLEGKAQLAACASTGTYYVEGDEASIVNAFKGLGNKLLTLDLHLIK